MKHVREMEMPKHRDRDKCTYIDNNEPRQLYLVGKLLKVFGFVSCSSLCYICCVFFFWLKRQQQKYNFLKKIDCKSHTHIHLQ